MSVSQYSKDQDSLDNIVVEEDFNQSEEVDSLHSFADLEAMDQKTNSIHEDFEIQQGKAKCCDLGRESQTVLKMIAAKSKTIFQLLSRAEFNEKESENIKNSSQQTKNQVLKRQFLNYSRRDKSLEELSKKFLFLFLDKAESLLSLDKITSQLGVERRRIYDIINILESLKLVSRKGKNNYKWNGFQRIYDTIHYYDAREITKKEEMDLAEENLQKREKSLEMLSIGFLQLFLHFKKTMTLEEAARKLSFQTIDDHKIKTKIRRLYDIANVFKSLGLIKKTSLTDTKKPAFCWVGINGLDQFAEKIINEKGNSTQGLTLSKGYLQNGNSDIENDMDNNLSIGSKECLKKVKHKTNNYNTINASVNSNKSEKRQQLDKSGILKQQEKVRVEKERIVNVFSQSSQQLLQTLSNSFNSNTNTACSQTTSILSNNELGCSDLLNNLIAKCLHNMLSNYLDKLTQPDQQQQQPQPALLQRNSSLSLSQCQKTFQESQSNNMNSNSSSLLNPLFNQKINNNLGQDNAFLTAKKIRTENYFSTNNFTQINHSNNIKQINDSEVNDENIPLNRINISPFNGGIEGTFANKSHNKTPAVKRTVNTIIQPRMEEYNTTEESITTTPGVKHSFSAVLPSGQDILFTDRTNIFQNSSKQISSTNNGFQQLSSFKKIRKLTFDNFSQNDSANKTTGDLLLSIVQQSENIKGKLQQQYELDQQQAQKQPQTLNSLLNGSSLLAGSNGILERLFQENSTNENFK